MKELNIIHCPISTKSKLTNETISGTITLSISTVSWQYSDNSKGQCPISSITSSYSHLVSKQNSSLEIRKSEQPPPRVRIRFSQQKEKIFCFDNVEDQKLFHKWIIDAINIKKGNIQTYTKQLTSNQIEQLQLLNNNEETRHLHQDLVPEFYTDEEFWDFYKMSFNPEQKFSSQRELINPTIPIALEPGISASFLTDIKQIMLNGDNVRVKLTSRDIDSIFRIYPEVKRKYKENVPNISAELFWKEFIESIIQFEFQKDTKKIGSDINFEECIASEEKKYNDLLSQKKHTLNHKTQPYETTSLEEEVSSPLKYVQGYFDTPNSEVPLQLRQLNLKSKLILQREGLSDCSQTFLQKQPHYEKTLALNNIDRYSSFSRSPPVSVIIINKESTYVSNQQEDDLLEISKCIESLKTCLDFLNANDQQWVYYIFTVKSQKNQVDVLININNQCRVKDDLTEKNSISLQFKEKAIRYQKFVSELLRHYWGSCLKKDQIERTTLLYERIKKIKKKFESKINQLSIHEAKIFERLTISIDTALSHYQNH